MPRKTSTIQKIGVIILAGVTGWAVFELAKQATISLIEQATGVTNPTTAIAILAVGGTLALLALGYKIDKIFKR